MDVRSDHKTYPEVAVSPDESTALLAVGESERENDVVTTNDDEPKTERQAFRFRYVLIAFALAFLVTTLVAYIVAPSSAIRSMCVPQYSNCAADHNLVCFFRSFYFIFKLYSCTFVICIFMYKKEKKFCVH